MWTDSELALVLVLANFLSACWSFFCIVSSLNHYRFMRSEEVVWYALWYSCTTYAFLVSVTNLAVAAYVAVRLGWRRKIFGRGRVVLRVLGAAVAAAGGAMLCFVPLRMTMLQAERAGVGSVG